MTVKRLWTVESNRILLVLFDSGRCLRAGPVMPGIGMRAFPIETGTVKPGADFGALNRTIQPLQTIAMRGMKFTGMEDNVVLFNHNYGARLTAEGVQWVMRPGTPPMEPPTPQG